jgi:hypothetical protein
MRNYSDRSSIDLIKKLTSSSEDVGRGISAHCQNALAQPVVSQIPEPQPKLLVSHCPKRLTMSSTPRELDAQEVRELGCHLWVNARWQTEQVVNSSASPALNRAQERLE